MSATPPQQGPCGKSIWWHYVRRTKAGVNAYCNVGPRVAVSRRLPPHRSASLEESARDVWDRIHTISAADHGVQERLLWMWLNHTYWGTPADPDPEPPHVIVASPQLHPLIRAEISEKAPDFPVRLMSEHLGDLLGLRVRSFELRPFPSDVGSRRWQAIREQLQRSVSATKAAS